MLYKKLLHSFLDFPWERDCEIEFVDLLESYAEEFQNLSESYVRENIRRLYEEVVDDLVVAASSDFIEFVESLI
jgi:hypothetical protein